MSLEHNTTPAIETQEVTPTSRDSYTAVEKEIASAKAEVVKMAAGGMDELIASANKVKELEAQKDALLEQARGEATTEDAGRTEARNAEKMKEQAHEEALEQDKKRTALAEIQARQANDAKAAANLLAEIQGVSTVAEVVPVEQPAEKVSPSKEGERILAYARHENKDDAWGPERGELDRLYNAFRNGKVPDKIATEMIYARIGELEGKFKIAHELAKGSTMTESKEFGEKSPEEKMNDHIEKFKEIKKRTGSYNIAFNVMRNDKAIDFDNNDSMVVRFVKGIGDTGAIFTLRSLGKVKEYPKNTVLEIINSLPTNDSYEARDRYRELKFLASDSGLEKDKDVIKAILEKNSFV